MMQLLVAMPKIIEVTESLLIPAILILLFKMAAMCFIFKKRGITPWHGMVPVLGGYRIYSLVWKKPIVFIISMAAGTASLIMLWRGLYGRFTGSTLTLLITGFAVLAAFLVTDLVTRVRLARSFGKKGAFLAGMAVIPVIFLAVLAWGKTEEQ